MAVAERINLVERRERSVALFREDSPIVIFDAEAYADITLREYLKRRGASVALLDLVFTPEGRWALQGDPYLDIYSDKRTKTPDGLNAYLAGYTKSIGTLVQMALDTQKSYGFNLHDESHIDFVTNKGLELLDRSPHRDNQTKWRLVAAARGHDLGNIIDRNIHSTISPLIFRRMFPDITSKPEYWEIIKRAMELHDEKVLATEIDSWGALNATQIIQRLRILGPELLALVMADKVHIGPERIPRNIPEENMLEAVNDPHVEANMFADTVHAGLSPDDRETFRLQFNFNPKRALMKGVVSERLRTLFKKEKEPYFRGWENIYWDIYYARTIFTMLCAFALCPQLKRFEIITRDPIEGHPELGTTNVEVFHRDFLDQHIARFAIAHGHAKSASIKGLRRFI